MCTPPCMSRRCIALLGSLATRTDSWQAAGRALTTSLLLRRCANVCTNACPTSCGGLAAQRALRCGSWQLFVCQLCTSTAMSSFLTSSDDAWQHASVVACVRACVGVCALLRHASLTCASACAWGRPLYCAWQRPRIDTVSDRQVTAGGIQACMHGAGCRSGLGARRKEGGSVFLGLLREVGL